MMEKIIVGVDAEAASATAVAWVAIRARSREVSVDLVTVLDALGSNPDSAHDRLASLRSVILAAAPETEVRVTVPEGPIAPLLQHWSENADLLVIGSHRDRPLRAALTGSLPVRIASGAACPTVVIPLEWEGRHLAGPVLVGMEADGSSAAAIQFAAREAASGRHELRMLHAWRLPPASLDALQALVVGRPRDRAWHRELLAHAGRDGATRFPELEIVEQLTESLPAAALVQVGRDASMIVVGTHGRGPVSGMAMGSTSMGVLQHSSTPVCLVPRADRHLTVANNRRVHESA
jgi:nucleotide-binding universal stress UspA family protein